MLLSNSKIDVSEIHSNVTPSHFASIKQLLAGPACGVGWNREVNTIINVTGMLKECVYADDFAIQIQKWPAAVSEIDDGGCF